MRVAARRVMAWMAGISVLAFTAQGAGIRNLATNGTANASGQGVGSTADDAIDGNRDRAFDNGSVWHAVQTNDVWFQVDLGGEFYLDRVQIVPRDTTPHWTDFTITVRDAGDTVVFEQDFLPANNLDATWGTTALRGVRGQTVRIERTNATATINAAMAEFEVWGHEAEAWENLADKAIASGQAGGFGTTIDDIRDRNIDGDFGNPGYPVYHAASGTATAGKHVTLDVGSSVTVSHLNLFARSDADVRPRLRVELLDEFQVPVFTSTNDLAGDDFNAPRYDVTVVPPADTVARFARVTTLDDEYLCLAELEIMAAKRPFIQGADILIQPAPAILGTRRDDHSGQVGNGFSIPAASPGYTAHALGFWDDGLDGLAYAHKVGLWYSADGGGTATLLGSVTIPAGTQAPLYFNHRWVTLNPPVVLSATGANDRYLVGVSLSSGGGDNRIDTDLATGGWRFNPLLQEGSFFRQYETLAWPEFPDRGTVADKLHHAGNLSTAGLPPKGTVLILR
jgi:hypothetical protein